MSITGFFVQGHDMNRIGSVISKEEQIIGDEKQYKEYCILLKKYLVPERIHESLDEGGHDTKGHHYLISTATGAAFLVGTGNTSVAEILSEPEFAKRFIKGNIPCEGLKIKMNNKNYHKMILQLANEYQKMFNEKVEIIS